MKMVNNLHANVNCTFDPYKGLDEFSVPITRLIFISDISYFISGINPLYRRQFDLIISVQAPR